MSFLSWLSGKSSVAPLRPATTEEHDSSGLTREDRTRPLNGRERPAAPAGGMAATFTENGPGGAERKSRRHARRELLYIAVRESMTRGGVLSASFKFKVLSLDPHGEQFMVMMDLAQESGGQTERLSELEAMIAQTAKARFQIRVTAVYWRMNETVTVGKVHAPRPVAAAPQPSELVAASGSAAPPPVVPQPVLIEKSASLPGAVAGLGLPPQVKRRDPLLADEVTAFKKALAAASAQGASAADIANRAVAPNRPVTGFEDTELPAEDRAHAPALSNTQYGELN